MKNPSILRLISTCLVIGLAAPLHAEKDPAKDIPDLTKGGELSRNNERWAATIGIHCGAWRPRQRSQEFGHVKQLLVQQVEEGSPADGVLKVGDVILGADGTGAKEVPLFQGGKWPMIPLADAITEAEAHNPAILKLRIWRPAPKVQKEDPNAVKAPTLDDVGGGLKPGGTLDDWGPSPNKKPKKKAEPKVLGKEMTVTIKLDYLGRYSDTAPYNCEKSKNILKKGIDALLKEEKGDEAGFSILCLLAAAHPDDPRYDAMMAKAKQWAHELKDGGSPWFVGPKMMALSEYYMKSKDESIRPKLQAMADYHAGRVSWFGTCGHRYSEPRPDGSPNGRIAGYGPITASGALGYLGLSLAREAGMDSESIRESHRAQQAFFGHFGGKSGMGYGEMPYGIGGGGGDYNGKCSNSGLAISLVEGQEDKAKFFAKTAALSSYGVRQYAHGGTYFGQVFHPIAAAVGGEKLANLQFEEVSWHMDLKRRWDYRYCYDSSGNSYKEFDHAAVALIFYALPLKQIVITGRDRNPDLELTDKEFEDLLKVKNYDASKLTVDQLLADLPTCQGFLRSRVGGELALRVKKNPEAPEASEIVDRLIKMAADPNAGLYGQVGACYALMHTKLKSKVPRLEPASSLKNAEIAAGLVPLLSHENAYIRFAAVRVLEKMPADSIRPHADAIMDAIAATGRPLFPLDMEDPLQWAHGEMGALLVRKALKDGLEGINREKLIPAVRSLLETPNGGARGACSAILSKLNKEETLLVSDLLVHNIKVSPPGNAMGGWNSILNSQKALAAHNFEEAISLSVSYGPEKAIMSKVPHKFGKATLGMSSAREVMKTAGEQMLVNAVDTRELIEATLKGEGPKELDVLKRIESVTAADPVLKLPANTTELVADATNYSDPDGDQTTYTWRKVYGAGKVSFNPNASGDSKTTTVTFADKKPGKYCFELEMTDELGLTTVRETVTVTLNASSGKLPANKAPKATSQTLAAMPGFPVAVTFSGSDPDGDKLGFTVTQLPEHGVLSAAGGRRIIANVAIDGPITYTADFGHEGADQLTFAAIDGQGERAEATIKFNVSAAKVPVVVYEGFEYPMGGVHGKEGGSSFGFIGPWKNSRGTDKNYQVYRAPLNAPDNSDSVTYPGLPSSDGKINGGGHTTVSRFLDTKLLAKHGMLEPGGELWFSAFVDGTAQFNLSGPHSRIGFEVSSNQWKVNATLNGKPTGENHQQWSRSAALRFKQGEPAMIVGHCHWGRTDDEPDTLTLYRVYNAPVFGPMLIDKPAAEMKELIDQEKINAIMINIAENRAIDEIRIGTSPASVMQGTVPLK